MILFCFFKSQKVVENGVFWPFLKVSWGKRLNKKYFFTKFMILRKFPIKSHIHLILWNLKICNGFFNWWSSHQKETKRKKFFEYKNVSRHTQTATKIIQYLKNFRPSSLNRKILCHFCSVWHLLINFLSFSHLIPP